MLQKFLSRKFLMALAAFISVSVEPNLPITWRAILASTIALVYAVLQAYVDKTPTPPAV